ncbi:MAG: mannitol dehydrogenase family protein [Lachnospiraceae bacterium]|nr:mannitol dehydrogenase family protein [Lachnospiraceae bacterium]
MRLTDTGLLKDREEYTGRGYDLPAFDREQVRKNTLDRPEWIHFGAGNIFRAFQGNLMQSLLNAGAVDTGIVVCEGYDYEIIEKMYRPHDNLSILATLKADGTADKTVIGSIVESLILDRDCEQDFARLSEIFRSPSLKMASFTITEKGYVVNDTNGDPLPAVTADLEAGPAGTHSYVGKIASLLHERYTHGACPIAFVSMDNCSHNGDKLKSAILTFAEGWEKRGRCEAGFLDYCSSSGKVSYPWSMIDKITPRPDAQIETILSDDGVEGLEPVITSKKTYVAPFVNAEETEYLVIEDSFPNGRLPLDKVGVIYTERETVDKVEKMKVCTCLNPLHTALAIFGCLLGYKTIHDEMEDEDLKKLVNSLGYDEGMKTVVDPGVMKPAEFLDTVLTRRLPNPFMPDTPQRIACDTSQKLPIRFGETIKAYRSRDDLSTDDLKLIPLVLAAYLRYLRGTDDNGEKMELSPDPMLDELTALTPEEVLHRSEVFGTDLFADGLGDRILAIYEEIGSTPGSVRSILKKTVG